MTNPNPVAPKTDTPATEEEMIGWARRGREYRERQEQEDKPRVPDQTLATNMRKTLKVLCDAVDGWQKKCAALESTLAAERASRVQAEEALKEIADFKGRTLIGHSREDGASYSAGANAAFERCAGITLDALSKPSVSPEQAEEKR